MTQTALPLMCDQCEQTMNGTGCAINGNPGKCGKDKDVQSLQEILLYGLKGMAAYANHARRLGKTDEAVSAFIEEALFATMTNVTSTAPPCWARPGVRPAEPARHGTARPGARRAFRQPAPATVQEGTGRAGHPGHRSRPARPGQPAASSARAPRQGLHPRRNAAGPHVSQAPRTIPTWPATTAAPGRSRRPSSTPSPAPIVATTNCVLIPRAELRRPPVHHPRHGRPRRHAARSMTISRAVVPWPAQCPPLAEDARRHRPWASITP